MNIVVKRIIRSMTRGPGCIAATIVYTFAPRTMPFIMARIPGRRVRNAETVLISNKLYFLSLHLFRTNLKQMTSNLKQLNLELKQLIGVLKLLTRNLKQLTSDLKLMTSKLI